MAKLDLRSIPRNDLGKIAVGQGSGIATSQDQLSHDTSHAIPSFSVDVRREIYIAVMNADRAVSRAEIAKLVNRKKTPYLVEAIEDLVERGYLLREHGTWRNGTIMFFYSINEVN